jgi:drug/metabolite transporter (DMT)-like permease
MIYLLLCILSTTSIMIVFKLLGWLRVSTINAIVINYFTAAILGYIAVGPADFNPVGTEWFHMALIMGFIFVFMFYVIGYSARIAGITVTSLTTKLSVVIPVVFSIIVFNEELTIYRAGGMILALIAIFMIVIKPTEPGNGERNLLKILWLPAVLFFGAGFIDSLIKYTQEVYITGNDTLSFATVTFMSAAITSILFRFAGKFEKQEDKWYRLFAGGIALGVVNFGSLYFLVMALASDHIASSVVFGINNIGIVLVSVITGTFLFKERLSKLNFAGIVIAIVAILILFYA